MLERLHIENLAVIESLDLDLSSGFSVLTGETGAGKSVLIHSLNLILGERVGKDLVRSGCDKATVSALFTDLPTSLLNLLAEQGFDGDGEVLIQRDLTAEGRSSVRINGRPSTVAILRSFGERLVNIHGQHDNRALLDASTHVLYLDAYADNGVVKERYVTHFRALKEVLKQIAKINTDEKTRMQRMDLLSFQLNEIETADLRPGEEEELSRRREILVHAEKIESALASAYSLCSEENNARDKLSRAESELESVASLNGDLAQLASRMTSLCEDLEDLSADLRSFLDSQSFDGGELSALEERLDLIYRLKRKYGSTIEEILSYRDWIAEELDGLKSSEERLEALLAKKAELSALVVAAGKELTASRENAGKTLEKVLTEQLAFLDMPNTGFKVQIASEESYTPNGVDRVEFLLSANLGESLRPLSKIASGGELSRIMLCMKTVLNTAEDAQTLIFDEVDTGVSGKAAEKIAIKLKEISKGKQVIVVTHLAQIAAYAHSHFLIAKAVSNQRTYTTVAALDKNGRIDELARIMGGMEPTSSTRAAAEDLLVRGGKI